jgi:GDP-4-dehydro-6-deoxy-D-mannose reductase
LHEGPVLLTGSAGFVAPYLMPRLAAAFPGRPIVPTVRVPPAPESGLAVDLTDPRATDAMVARVRPAVVVHLAAHSSVARASRAPAAVWRDNRDGSYWLARAIARHAPEATVLAASTAEIYGKNLNLGPASEDTPPAPHGPYATSKRAAEVVLDRVLPHTARLIVPRPFNHTGPGQGETFVVASFAAQIARIEAGLSPPRMMVGNLAAERDFMDVRDVAACYVALLAAADGLPSRSVFNVARGEATPVRTLLDMLLALSAVSVDVTVDPARLRPNEIPRATARTDKLARLVPRPCSRSLAETLSDVLDDQRARVSRAR